MATSWNELLRKTHIKDIVKAKHKDLVYVAKGTHLGDALQVLSANNILAAPVIDETTHTALGFLDVLDVAGFVLDSWSKIHDRHDRNFARQEFFDVPVERVLDYSKVDYAFSIPDVASVADLILLFNEQKTHNRLHRVAVSTEAGKLYNVVSQSDIIAFAQKHQHLIPEAQKTLQELGIVRSTVMARIDAPFYETLEILYRNRVSGVALVDNNGHIDANFSASDLRGLTQKSFDLFTGSTLQFLIKGAHSKGRSPITKQIDSTLGSAIDTLVSQAVHRVYVVGPNDYPYGVISLGDVIQVLRPRSR